MNGCNTGNIMNTCDRCTINNVQFTSTFSTRAGRFIELVANPIGTVIAASMPK